MNPSPTPASEEINRIFSVAPMLDWTDSHCRYFFRLLSSKALLYTEMVTSGAIIHGDRDRHLLYNTDEHPLALQLGGSHPQELADAINLAAPYGYDEYNLNCGCPSDRVQNGAFGACMMLDAANTRDCLDAMADRADGVPVTLKCRIGVDDHDSYNFFRDFIGEVTRSGSSNTIIVHARKAWLQGLSPKQNREIPPLLYPHVYQLKQDFPHLHISINGGITDIDSCKQHLQNVDGVMLGREIYQNPWFLHQVDEVFFGQRANSDSRMMVYEKYMDYCKARLKPGVRLHHMTRHILNLFNGEPGAKLFRRHISEHAWRENADISVMEDAARFLDRSSRIPGTQQPNKVSIQT